MKTTATLITCFTVSLIFASGNASAGNNRFSGKSGKSSSSRSFNHHGSRTGRCQLQCIHSKSIKPACDPSWISNWQKSRRHDTGLSQRASLPAAAVDCT